MQRTMGVPMKYIIHGDPSDLTSVSQGAIMACTEPTLTWVQPKFAFTLHFRKSNLGSTQVEPTSREEMA